MSLRRLAALWALIVFIAFGLWWFLNSREQPDTKVSTLPDICEELAFEGARFIVCTVDPATHEIRLHLRDHSGAPWRSLDRLAQFQKAKGSPLTFAMNAGMYHEDLSPVGLFVEDGRELAPLNTAGGKGNFFLKPNGVFGVYSDGQPFVVTSADYRLSARVRSFETQSGPMLVVDGAIHPKFEPDGQSRFTRNGVGIDEAGNPVFAISSDPVSFGVFARLFLDRLKCRNALYFDGVVSAFSDGDSTIEGGGFPAGPIVSVTER
jgi:uncharacterized protein YigE (DUF2233 family)